MHKHANTFAHVREIEQERLSIHTFELPSTELRAPSTEHRASYKFWATDLTSSLSNSSRTLQALARFGFFCSGAGRNAYKGATLESVSQVSYQKYMKQKAIFPMHRMCRTSCTSVAHLALVAITSRVITCYDGTKVM